MRAPNKWVARSATVLGVSPLLRTVRIGLERQRIQIDRNRHEAVAPDDFENIGYGNGGHQDVRTARKPGCLETGIEAAA